MSFFDNDFDDNYKEMFKKTHAPYDKYNLGLHAGKGVSEALSKICTAEELTILYNILQTLINRKGSIKSTWEMPEELRMLRYSYYDLNGQNTGNIKTKHDYKIMAKDIKKAICIINETYS